MQINRRIYVLYVYILGVENSPYLEFFDLAPDLALSLLTPCSTPCLKSCIDFDHDLRTPFLLRLLALLLVPFALPLLVRILNLGKRNPISS